MAKSSTLRFPQLTMFPEKITHTHSSQHTTHNVNTPNSRSQFNLSIRCNGCVLNKCGEVIVQKRKQKMCFHVKLGKHPRMRAKYNVSATEK